MSIIREFVCRGLRKDDRSNWLSLVFLIPRDARLAWIAKLNGVNVLKPLRSIDLNQNISMLSLDFLQFGNQF